MPTPGEHSMNSAELARTLDAAARRADADPDDAIARVPGLAEALSRDADARRFALWERSSIIDENVGGPVLPRPLFAALHERAGLDATWPIGNAGLVHVYGYLLSDVLTPYGLKRERWLDGALARAYGLADAAFLPSAHDDATPMTRVTRAASALLDAHTVRRERIGAITTRIAIGRHTASGPFALAYALDRGDGERLVTTFPVTDPDALLAGMDADAPRLRWNAAP